MLKNNSLNLLSTYESDYSDDDIQEIHTVKKQWSILQILKFVIIIIINYFFLVDYQCQIYFYKIVMIQKIIILPYTTVEYDHFHMKEETGHHIFIYHVFKTKIDKNSVTNLLFCFR